MRYEKPRVAVAASAVTAIQNPTPNPKLTADILDGGFSNSYHTVSAYAADE